jgi:hypothetical protein
LKAYGYKLLYFEGVTDGSIPHIGAMKWISDLGYTPKVDWEPYVYNDDGQLSGYITQYDDNLIYATVHGVGHMACQWKRQDVTTLIMKFIHEEPLL